MTAATPLPGMPEPATRDADYETWANAARPTFAAVAATGQPFRCWTVARDHRLPGPPNQKLDWARFISGLRHEGLIRQDGYGEARDGSAVKQWRGTPQARREVAA